MASSTSTPVPEFLAELGLEPRMVEQYRDFLASMETAEDVPARVLTLTALRVAAIKGREAQWLERNPDHGLTDADVEAVIRGVFDGFGAAERAALELTERLPLAWHSLTDEEVAAVTEHFGPKGCVSLMSAIAYFDVNDRLEATLSSLVSTSGAP